MTYSLPILEAEEINEPQYRNQWAEQISAQANAMPVSEKIWNQPPEEKCIQYEWPENAI